MVTCKRCRKQFSDNDIFTIKGKANVEGENSITDFKENGICWNAIDSWAEVWICPNCGLENEMEW